MKILFTLLNYGSLTGSELYVYELTRELSKKHEVVIQSTLSKNDLYHKTKVKMIDWNDLTFKPDIIHSQQVMPTMFAQVNYKAPVVQTIHSEILPEVEKPVKNCQYYISIRPEIVEFCKSYGFESDLIYNSFDFERFNQTKPNNKVTTVLFVGAVDHLRVNAIKSLIKQASEGKIVLIGVGRGWKDIKSEGVTGYEPMFDIEKMIDRCDVTAGIKLGRTTIEGWLCGRDGFIYDVDENGTIKGLKRFSPPKDLSVFDSKIVAKQLEDIYARCIHSYIR